MPKTPPPPRIAFDDFNKVDIRAGPIVAAEPLAGARKPALRLKIDFGPAIGLKTSSAQITKHYEPAALIGRQVAGVVNFPPRQVGKTMSEVLTLGFPDGNGEVVLITPERPSPSGVRLSGAPPRRGLVPQPRRWQPTYPRGKPTLLAACHGALSAE